MDSAETLGPPMTVKAGSASDSCADRVANAAEMLEEEDYEVALCLLLGDEDQEEQTAGGLSQREHLGMVAGTLGAAVPAMVAEVCQHPAFSRSCPKYEKRNVEIWMQAYEGLALLVRADYQNGESDRAKALALRYYEAAAPFLAASLPSLHPMAVRISSSQSIAAYATNEACKARKADASI